MAVNWFEQGSTMSFSDLGARPLYVPSEGERGILDPSGRPVTVTGVLHEYFGGPAEVRESVPEPEVPEPEVVVVDAEVADREYRRLARKLKVSTPSGLDAHLCRLLQREEVLVYPLGKVNAFLQHKAKRRNVVWKPLRKVDLKRVAFKASGVGWHMEPELLTDSGQHPKGADFRTAIYRHAVPIQALKVVEKVEKAMGLLGRRSVAFFVSDYEVPKPDPFLMIAGYGLERHYVVFHWDEPGFRV